MEHSDTVEIDKVISQDPKGEDDVPKNTKINLVISLGKKIETVEVPNLLGRSDSEAQVLLEANGLKIGNVSEEPTEDKSKDGKIISQSIPKGTKVEQETTVAVTVGKYTPPSVDLEQYLGSLYGGAKNRLNSIASEYKLTYEYKLNGKTIKAPEDQMVINDISPTKADEGSKVTITLIENQTEDSESGD